MQCFYIATVRHKTQLRHGVFALRSESDSSLVLLTPHPNPSAAPEGALFSDGEWEQIRSAMLDLISVDVAVSIELNCGLIVEAHK